MATGNPRYHFLRGWEELRLDWTAEATAVTLLGSKAALHKTNAGDREGREGSEGFHYPRSRSLPIPRQKLSGLSQVLYFKVWPAQPKTPPTFEDQGQSVSVGTDLHIRMQRPGASKLCM